MTHDQLVSLQVRADVGSARRAHHAYLDLKRMGYTNAALAAQSAKDMRDSMLRSARARLRVLARSTDRVTVF